MNRSLRYLAMGLCAAMLLTSAAYGQTTTGSIGGIVIAQADGSALPGAQVTAVHEPTGTRYTAVSDAEGRFRMFGVRVGGPYNVSTNMDGFHTQETSGVVIQLGETTDLKFQLQLESVAETVIVVGESTPLINSGRTGAASNVTTEALESLPTIDRGFNDFARTNPFFTIGSENEDPDAISVAGRSSRYNSISIDGSVNNDLFGLADTGTPGGQSGTTPISLDAIQELELVIADFDVRNGGFSGGGINAVTRSGSNNLKGSVFYYTR
ncbi:MAG: carboxypeptidase-like regulatory domain-containing protein, partial [Acidobacteriota bacterium]